jgi:hypothetical protein
MRSGSRGEFRFVHVATVVLAVSLVHTPLPQPDYHNIRHHDGPGEVCEHHDHLRRWHPEARGASDVAVLHWHWFLSTTPGEPEPEGSGLAIHAHLPDCAAPPWDGNPQVATQARPRPDLSPRLAVGPLGPVVLLVLLDVSGATPAAGHAALTGRCAPRARTTSLTALLQRWVC